MSRFSKAILVALAIGFPFSASAAENLVDQKTPEQAVVAAAEDAVIVPAPARKDSSEEKRVERVVPRGSSQSEAGFRFTTPYSVPEQTLPVNFPSFATFSF